MTHAVGQKYAWFQPESGRQGPRRASNSESDPPVPESAVVPPYGPAMATAREKMIETGARLACLPEAAVQVDGSVQFVLEGEGGSSWVMSFKGVPQVCEGTGDAQCTVHMTAEDFVEMREGRADAQQLFFAGRLRVVGDLSLAIKLGNLLDALR